MDSFINSSLPIFGYILILILIFGCAFLWEYIAKKKNPAKKSKFFEMNEKPLTSQTLFWLAIIIPFVSFGYFGYFSWHSKPFLFNAEGFERFIKISALPLGLLSLSIPFSAIVNNIHRTIQTNKQIQETGIKNNNDLYYSHRNNTINYFNNIGVVISSYKYRLIKPYTEHNVDSTLELSIMNPFHLYDFLFFHSAPSSCILSPADSSLFKINNAWSRINLIIESCITDYQRGGRSTLTILRKLILINKNLNIIERRLHLNFSLNKFNTFEDRNGSILFCVTFRSCEELNEKLKLSYGISKKIYSIIGKDLDKFVEFKFMNLFLSEIYFLFNIINDENLIIHKRSLDIGVCYVEEQPF